MGSGGAGGGIIGGAIGGGMVTRRTNNAAQHSLNQGTINQDVSNLENFLLPYNQLLQMGRINPTSAGMFAGLSGNQSVLGRDIQGFYGTLGAADPAFSGYQSAMGQTAAGLAEGGLGLPSDVQRNIENTLRSAQGSRGLLDSDTSAIQETAALMGGSEAIRSERLNQVSNYLSGTLSTALGTLSPNISMLYSGELQRAMQGSRNNLAAAQIGTGVLQSGVQAGGIGGGGGGF